MWLEVSHLYKKYGSHVVLEDINQAFRAGRVYGIMGENGAGKSTLFRCLMQLEKYDGKVTTHEGVK